jgi:hypothetical protein
VSSGGQFTCRLTPRSRALFNGICPGSHRSLGTRTYPAAIGRTDTQRREARVDWSRDGRGRATTIEASFGNNADLLILRDRHEYRTRSRLRYICGGACAIFPAYVGVRLNAYAVVLEFKDGAVEKLRISFEDRAPVASFVKDLMASLHDLAGSVCQPELWLPRAPHTA